MNTAHLKTFAPEVRRQLMNAVGRKLDFVLTGDTADLRAMPEQRKSLRLQVEQDRKGLIERVAYTWFNRLTALRFIDAHGWHPFRARVLMPASAAETQPEILKLTRTGALPEDLRPHTDPARLNNLLDGHIPTATPEADVQGEVYRHLVLAACRFYHAMLPNLFEKLDDETELLLPDDLLTEHSVVHGFRTEISDEDCGDGQRANVEILGWLYQFYISEWKDQVMARKRAVPTEDIPAVTQLFTPHWIVRYLVENSLGRLWLLNRPGSRLREHMPYYIKGEPETDFLKITKPEEIRLCDPAVGSGHMLTYTFDLLTLIYEEEGYAPTEIPALILRHNLYGLEICPRAAQLAELALIFKAREKSRRFFQPEHLVRPHIIELRDVRFAENELRDYIHALGLGDLFNQPMLKLLHQFEEAKNFGSLIQPCLDERTIAFVSRAIEAKDLGGQLFLRETHLKVLRVLEQAKALTQRYHVVVANPPYMGAATMNAKLKAYIADNYAEGKADLYGAFILRDLSFLIEDGSLGMITIPNWLFLESFADLRAVVLDKSYLSSLVQNGRGVWGGDFGSCGFTIVKAAHADRRGTFKKLFKKQGEIQSNDEIEANFHKSIQYPNYTACSADFEVIPGRIIAYWSSTTLRSAFTHSHPIGELVPIKSGMATTNNERFLRRWYEVSMNRTKLDARSHELASQSGRKWFPYKKGGDFRKWYGNDEYVLNWGNDGEEIKAAVVNNPADPRTTHWSRRIFGTEYFFLPSITWSAISASYFSVRVSGPGTIFSNASNGAFPKADLSFYASLLNSTLVSEFLKILSPTINSKAGDIARIPLLDNFPAAVKGRTALLGNECVAIARADWDNFETSWDFRDQPLLRPGLKGATLEASWRNWEAQSTAAIRRMQELETENNRLFIVAYGLDGELQLEVPEAQITLARAEARRDMAAFLSYAVGCMMGRYSLDHPGLILANAGDSLREFLAKVGRSQDQLTFSPDEDGIIPVLDGEWFEDDIVARARDFLRATFGEDTLNENIRFIEESLGKDLRKYFLTDFYKDHLQTYKKRPIYWMFSSPKKGFNALVYLHRYTKDTANGLLNRYLRDYLQKISSHLEHLDHVQATAESTREKTAARKERDALNKTLRECEEYERETLLPLAQQRIELDLDDGVKVNYLKLGDALVPVPGLAAKADD